MDVVKKLFFIKEDNFLLSLLIKIKKKIERCINLNVFQKLIDKKRREYGGIYYGEIGI